MLAELSGVKIFSLGKLLIDWFAGSSGGGNHFPPVIYLMHFVIDKNMGKEDQPEEQAGIANQ